VRSANPANAGDDKGEKEMSKRAILAMAAMFALVVPQATEAKPVPNLEFKDLSGARKGLADLCGSIAVVNFWATWCGPCREELPLLTRLSMGYSAKKVRFLEISEDENEDSKGGRAKIDAFMKAHGPRLEVWAGADTDTLSRLGLGIELPATLIFNEDGEVICRLQGEARETDLRTALDWLLNGKTGPAAAAMVKHL
jgi:thiol-disulfide isomerase/thioredoxin